MSDQRTDYGNKSSEHIGNKQMSSKPAEMIKAGGSGDGSGPTGSSRSYPKGSGHKMPDFTAPITKGKRTATDWAVGGV